jgi:4-amino-4-deoxy-L-arabinose transferase-like glycosyltransferase
MSQGRKVLLTYGFLGLVLAGGIVRLLVVVVADDKLTAPWGGTGDAPAYVLLAQNLAAGKGYTYAGQPTAFRAPVYPIVLAALMKLFGQHLFEAVRLEQFFMGLLIAYLCASVAGKVFGEPARRATLVIAMFSPTLIVMTGEILTETSATLMSAIFLYLLTRFSQKPNWIILTCLSAIVGLATLVRFNMALLGFVALGMVLFNGKGLPKWRGAALTILLPALIV